MSYKELNKDAIRQDRLINGFNNKKVAAFTEVYTLMHRELKLYANSLYRDIDIECEDIVHDVFVNLWESKKQFNSLKGLKSYIYLSIKNGFLNYIERERVADKYSKTLSLIDNSSIDIIDSELFSLVDYSLGLLPEKYATILKLFLEGYSSAEISQKLDKPIQTVYNSKNEALKILQNKLTKDKMLTLSNFINIFNI